MHLEGDKSDVNFPLLGYLLNIYFFLPAHNVEEVVLVGPCVRVHWVSQGLPQGLDQQREQLLDRVGPENRRKKKEIRLLYFLSNLKVSTDERTWQ